MLIEARRGLGRHLPATGLPEHPGRFAHTARQAARNGESQLIALHDVVALVRTLLSLSAASYVRELVLPAIADERF
tara:strand:+ start:4713 stop:4940 length:228 start_codon:yes stop_codon:yes gene_type:complete